MINTVFSINPCLVGSAVGILLFSNSNVNQLYLQTFIYLMHFKIYVFFVIDWLKAIFSVLISLFITYLVSNDYMLDTLLEARFSRRVKQNPSFQRSFSMTSR